MMRGIAAVRIFYLLLAVFWGAGLVGSLVEGPSLRTLGLGGGLLLIVATIVMLRRHPFAWSLVISIIWTVQGVFHLVHSGEIQIELFILAALWIFMCWIILPSRARMNNLIAEFPNLWASKRLRPGGHSHRVPTENPDAPRG